MPQPFPFIPGTLPYEVHNVWEDGSSGVWEWTEIPTKWRSSVQVTVQSMMRGQRILLTGTIITPELTDDHLYVTYIPASEEDQALVTQYGDICSVPAYLLRIKPILMAGERILALGEECRVGEPQRLFVDIIRPQHQVVTVPYEIFAPSSISFGVIPYSPAVIERDEQINDIIPEARQNMLHFLGLLNDKYFEHVYRSADRAKEVFWLQHAI